MKHVMQNAWTLARKGAKRFGGRVSLYFRVALVLAWKDYKAGLVAKAKGAQAILTYASPAIASPALAFASNLGSRPMTFLDRSINAFALLLLASLCFALLGLATLGVRDSANRAMRAQETKALIAPLALPPCTVDIFRSCDPSR
jgi:hypothetical protein